MARERTKPENKIMNIGIENRHVGMLDAANAKLQASLPEPARSIYAQQTLAQKRRALLASWIERCSSENTADGADG